MHKHFGAVLLSGTMAFLSAGIVAQGADKDRGNPKFDPEG
jgi:hypothetical protein